LAADARHAARNAEEAHGTAAAAARTARRRAEAAEAERRSRAEDAQAEENRLGLLRSEARDRARSAFLAQPARDAPPLEAFERFRPVLEDEASARKLAAALHEIAGRDRVKSIALGGARWYPRRTVLEMLEGDLPDLLDRWREARAEARRAVREAR